MSINDSNASSVVQYLKRTTKPNGIASNSMEIWRIARWCNRQLFRMEFRMLFAAFVVLTSNRLICWITCWLRAKRWAIASMSSTATTWKRKWCSSMDLLSSRQMWFVQCMMTASKSYNYSKTDAQAFEWKQTPSNDQFELFSLIFTNNTFKKIVLRF